MKAAARVITPTTHGTLPTLANLPDVTGKRVVVRVDLNVPMAHGKVIDTTRIDRVLSTIRLLQKKNAKVILLSHFGRPKGSYNHDYSLAPIADALSAALGESVKFAVDCIGQEAEKAVAALQNGEVLLCENVRFHGGEEKNELDFSKALAALGDLFVNDAFSSSHRAHASVEGITHYLPSYAGLSLEEEISELGKIFLAPAKPFGAIVGGSKVSTKIELLSSLIEKADFIIIGGGMANTFLAAEGVNIGASLYEKDYVSKAKEIRQKAEAQQCSIVLPSDVVVSEELKSHAPCRVVSKNKIGAKDKVLDIGPQTVTEINLHLMQAKTLVWNGPLGAFEFPPFDIGTASVARMIGSLTHAGKLTSVAGGGDVIAAIGNAGLTQNFTYISTAGGAFLEWLEGKDLPGISALYVHATHSTR